MCCITPCMHALVTMIALPCNTRPPGGDPDSFKEINEAYDVLKDPKKREIYDRVR